LEQAEVEALAAHLIGFDDPASRVSKTSNSSVATEAITMVDSTTPFLHDSLTGRHVWR
jgi:hypothetical protein